MIFYLTLFYKKNEIATRISLFWSSTVAAHAYGKMLTIHSTFFYSYRIMQLVFSLMAFWDYGEHKVWLDGRLVSLNTWSFYPLIKGQKWLFLIEGIPTVLIAIIAWFYLPASPETWSILTLEEQQLAVSRLAFEDGRHVSLGDLDASNRKQAIKAMTDWKVWMWMIMFFSGSVANTSISKQVFLYP